MKNNPWNVQMNVDFDQNHKKIFWEWYSKREKITRNKRCEFVKNNPLNKETKEYLEGLYYEGYGFRTIGRYLDISYPRSRRLFIEYFGTEVRKGLNVVTDKCREFRKNRVTGDKSPFYNWPQERPFLSKRSETGIQGYYIRKDNSPVWLRSSWEYIFAKWMDKNNIEWSMPGKSYKLFEGKETYLPDFIIYQDDTRFFVEIKGTRYQHRLYKVEQFRKEYPDNKISVIDDITPFIPQSSTYKKELEEWRATKLSKQELLKKE